MLLAAALLAPLQALAGSEMDQRIIDLRDQIRLFPDQVLAQLLDLQSQTRAEPPRTQAELLVQISAARWQLNQLDAAAATAAQVIAYGRKLGDDVIIAKGMLANSAVATARDDFRAAHQMAIEAEPLALRAGDKSLLVEAELAASTVAKAQGNFPAALAKLQLAVDSARQVGDDPMQLFNATRMLIRFYCTTKDREKAFATLDELTAMTAKQSLPVQMVLLKLSEHTVSSAFDQPERGLRAELDNLALQRRLGASHMLGSTLNNLADSYLKRRDYAQAARYASEALQATKGRNDTDSDATARVNLGHAYLGLGRVAEGKKNFEAGLAWFERFHSKPAQQEVLLEYGQALEDAGDIAGAVAAYHRERALSNELFEAKRQQTVLELQAHYEADKKQRQIELLSNENAHRRQQQRVWWLLAAVFALAAVVVGLLYRKVRHANARLEEKNLELKAQSSLDPLTGLYNRRHFQNTMAALNPDHGRPACDGHGDDIVGAMFLLDADHFKQVNDTYGHAAGDAVLKMIAASLRVALRETDMIVRWGGEEFLAFIPALPRHHIDEVAQRILAAIASQTVRHHGHDISVRVSIGFAPFPLAPAGVPLSWERVVNLTDMALYLAKTTGRNRAFGVRGFDSVRLTSMEEVERDLERAWRSGQVDLNLVLADAPAG
ncbi:MAG TPA: diguanylate cyclase [Duganella sp.]|uniref:diguanylate cyclase n=1 Tax=Duganella sp. TaxID=1904440 RepID=UPI002ED66D9A